MYTTTSRPIPFRSNNRNKKQKKKKKVYIQYTAGFEMVRPISVDIEILFL